MNPIFQQTMNNTNPMTQIQQLAMSNPQFMPILNMLQNGVSPEVVFRELARQRGINPDEFIKAFNYRR